MPTMTQGLTRGCERRGGELEKCRGKENEERKINNKTKYEKTKLKSREGSMTDRFLSETPYLLLWVLT